jgi:hypothetical protein
MSKAERFVVLPQKLLLDRVKYADFSTASQISRQHAEKDREPQYVVKLVAVSDLTAVAATRRLDEEEATNAIRPPVLDPSE